MLKKFDIICLVLVILAYSEPGMCRSIKSTSRTPTLLISMDGFRADKLDKFLSENPESCMQREFVEKGVKADYMNPSFPSLTFPNHYTLVTGKNIDKHDIISNQIYDPVYDEKVNFLYDKDSNDVKWWNSSDPIWLTAKDQGLITSSFFWVGSEVWTRHPDIFLTYNNRYEFKERCDEVVNWISKFQMDFTTLYFNEPDHTGHFYGPDSVEYRYKIVEMDGILAYLLDSLNARGLLDKLNILLVSDHGMATMKPNSTILVGDYVDTKLIDSSKTIYNVVSSIYPINDSVLSEVYNALKKVPNMQTYYKNEVPEELFYKLSRRIGPIVTIADEGYYLSTKLPSGTPLAGNHGFNSKDEDMRAIFMARGPDFKPNTKLPGFRNVDVYPLMCKLIDIDCHESDGTSETFKSVLNR